MSEVFANTSAKESVGAKLIWAKEITSYDIVISITTYCWVCNIIRVRCITIMPQKGIWGRKEGLNIWLNLFYNTSGIKLS